MDNKCKTCIWRDQCGEADITECPYYDSENAEDDTAEYAADLQMREEEYADFVKEQRR